MLFKKLKSIYYGYIIVAAAFVIMAMIWGMWATFGVFFDPLLKEFGWTRAAASGASSLNNILFGLVCIFSAGLSDKLGPRKVIIGCSILLGISYFLMSRVESLWEMYLYFGVLVSLGMSSYIPLLSLVARWFTRRRGMVTGIVFSGMGLGTMLLPLAANQLIVYYSWRMAFIILAVLALALTLIAALFMKAAPEHSRGEPNNEPGRGSTFMEAVRTRQFILLCVLYFCFLFCLVTIMVHVVIHGIGLGIAAADAAFILAIIGGACIVGMNVMGAASDRAGIPGLAAIRRNGLGIIPFCCHFRICLWRHANAILSAGCRTVRAEVSWNYPGCCGVYWYCRRSYWANIRRLHI
jgi:MFS family permease